MMPVKQFSQSEKCNCIFQSINQQHNKATANLSLLKSNGTGLRERTQNFFPLLKISLPLYFVYFTNPSQLLKPKPPIIKRKRSACLFKELLTFLPPIVQHTWEEF